MDPLVILFELQDGSRPIFSAYNSNVVSSIELGRKITKINSLEVIAALNSRRPALRSTSGWRLGRVSELGGDEGFYRKWIGLHS